MTNKQNNFSEFFKRILILNIIFLFSLTAISFIFFIMYDINLISTSSKFHILEIFAQNTRFSLSALSYINIPIFIICLLIVAFSSNISKFIVSLIKGYYIVAFTFLFTLQIIPMLSLHLIAMVHNFPSQDMIANLISIFITMDSKYIILFALLFTFIIIAISMFFALFTIAIVESKEYNINNKRKSVIIVLISLFFLIFFAKGKLIGHLSYTDSYPVSDMKINKYAINGVYKIAETIVNFNPVNIIDFSSIDKDDILSKDEYLNRFNSSLNADNFSEMQEVKLEDLQEKFGHLEGDKQAEN